MIRLVYSLLILAVGMAGGTPIQTLAEVRALSAEEAAKELPVQVEGIVIYAEPDSPHVVLHDGSAGCYVEALPLPGGGSFQPGARVRVTGVTRDGSFFPDIQGAEISLLGQGNLPAPRKVKPADLFSTWVDSEWVEVEAIVVATETRGLAYTLVVEVAGQSFKADVPNRPGSDKLAEALMQRKVRLRGIVGTVYNENRQLAGRHFLIPSFDQITPLEPALPENPPRPRPIRTLLQNDQGLGDLVMLHGMVTSSGTGGFYLRDESGSTFVHAIQGEIHPPGSEVEVVGFAAVAPFRPVFRAAAVRPTGGGGVPTPMDFDAAEKPRWAALHYELVRVACEFVSQRDSLTGTILQCRAGGIFFEAWLEGREAAAPGPQPGDRLALTGILEVTTTRPIPRPGWVDGFRVHLTGPAAVTITRKAPWWTPARILATLGISISIILLVFGWNWLLRRQVARQSAIISRQAELATVRDERQRIARELHDTLEQELTGLSMQLGNVSAEIGEDDAPARRGLTLAQRMLQHCRLEARASVSDLRNPNLLARDLPEALREALTIQVDGSGATLDYAARGTLVPLRATTQNHLLRIARESVANALSHGKATHVRCHLTYSEDGVALEIEDDGGGFDSSQPPPVGHFGLTGMQERANKVQAGFSLISKPGSGTHIRVDLPYASPEAFPRKRKHHDIPHPYPDR